MSSSLMLSTLAVLSLLFGLVSRSARTRVASVLAGVAPAVLYGIFLALRNIPQRSDSAAIAALAFGAPFNVDQLFSVAILSAIGHVAELVGGGQRFVIITILACSLGMATTGYMAILQGRLRRLLGLSLFALMITSSALFHWSNVLLQGLAASLVILALGAHAMDHRRWAILLLLVASMVHFSAAAMLIAYSLANVFQRHWCAYLLAATLAVGAGLLLESLLGFLPTFGMEWLAAKYRVYGSASYSLSWTIAKLSFPIACYIPLALVLKERPEPDRNRYDRVYYDLIRTHLALLSISGLFLASPKVTARLLLFHGMIAPLILVMTLEKIKKPGKSAGYAIGSVFALVYGIFVALHPSVAHTITF